MSDGPPIDQMALGLLLGLCDRAGLPTMPHVRSDSAAGIDGFTVDQRRGGRRMSRAIKHSGEQDVHTGWRKLYAYTQRAGTTSKIKRGTRRRERREAKDSIRNNNL